jgi:Ion channel
MVHPIQSDDQAVTGRRFLLLFIFLLATLIVYPYTEANRLGYFAFRVLGSAAILLSVYAANFRRSLLIFALVLAVPAIFQRILLPNVYPSWFSILNLVLSLVFDVFVVIVLFRHVFSKVEANSENIFGALCIYLLVGFSFASVYGMVAALRPGAFYLDPLTNLHSIPDRFDFVIYSFGTLTTLGAQGMTAVSAQARSVSIFEAIVGILYLAVMIARLVGAYRPSFER